MYMVTCQKCGVSSEYAEGFIKRGALGAEMFCPPCWQSKQRRNFILAWTAYFAGGLLGLLLYVDDPDLWFASVLMLLWLLQVFLAITIIPHELGHALIARWLGWRVFRIVIGMGKTCARCRFAGFDFDWRPVLLGGMTLIAPRNLAWFRMKLFASVLAGLLVNVALGAAMLLFYPWQEIGAFDLDYLPSVPKLFLFANTLVVLLNLWPRTWKQFGIEVPSDGKQLLKAFFVKKTFAEEKHAAYFVMEGYEALYRHNSDEARLWVERGLERYPEDFNLLNAQGAVAIQRQDFTLARQSFLQLLARENLKPIQRYVVANNLAYVDALTGSAEWFDEANRLSLEAYSGLPWAPFAIGTRGTVLVEHGELNEGIALLERAFKETEDVLAKAENACFLAVAECRRGDSTRAKHYLALAEKLNPASFLLPRAQSAVHSLPAVQD